MAFPHFLHFPLEDFATADLAAVWPDPDRWMKSDHRGSARSWLDDHHESRYTPQTLETAVSCWDQRVVQAFAGGIADFIEDST